MPPVSLLIKPASGSCNMRCDYCFYADEMKKRGTSCYGKMSRETLKAVVEKTYAFAEGSCTFAFQGGEPTLAGLDFFQYFIELQQRFNTSSVPTALAIQTNGYALTAEWADFFAKNHFLVGLSVDGIRYTHDAYRRGADGGDTFARVMRTAELFDKYHVDYNVLTVVNRRTAERIGRIYEFYRKQGWRYQQYIACLDPIGEQPGGRPYSLTPDIYGKFLVELFELWYLDLMKGEQPYIRQFENYVGILMGIEPEACDQRGCCSVQHVVEADGSVYPCDFYVSEAWRMGSFLTDSLEKMDRRALQSGFIEASMHPAEECRRCPYALLCRGGCRRNRDAGAGRPGGIVRGLNCFCDSYKYFFERELPKLQDIAKRLRMRNVH